MKHIKTSLDLHYFMDSSAVILSRCCHDTLGLIKDLLWYLMVAMVIKLRTIILPWFYYGSLCLLQVILNILFLAVCT